MRAARLILSVTFVVGLSGLGQLACKRHRDTVSNATAAVGSECTPRSESAAQFSGFKITEDTLELNAPECGGGHCMINHFQGRVSCPLGQPAPTDGAGEHGCVPEPAGDGEWGRGSCVTGFTCRPVASTSAVCDPAEGEEADIFCANVGQGPCNEGGYCECATDTDCPSFPGVIPVCDVEHKQCVAFACYRPDNCQDPDAPATENAGKGCCQEGTDLPVVTAVCGQCKGSGDQPSPRDADGSVYCTCRCGVAEGAPDEPDYPFCTCPDGFECTELRANLDLGDPEATGKFCMKPGTLFEPDVDQCGDVDGHWSAGNAQVSCAGVGTGKCMGDTPCTD